MSARSFILVIRLSALGDFVQSFGALASIRAHHADAHVTLLTTRPYAELARRSPWFDDVWVDSRPKVWALGRVLALRRRLRSQQWDRVYDLQTSERSSFYYWLVRSMEWSGIARGCSHPHTNPNRRFMHTLERQADQLSVAGVPSAVAALDWLTADTSRFALPPRFALLFPSCSPHNSHKRWPASSYGTLAQMLAARAVTPVMVGAAPIIRAMCPKTISLIAKTNLFEVAALARQATVVVGNDSGPSHLAAAVGAATLGLYSAVPDPELRRVRGPRADALSCADLGALCPEQVCNRAITLCGLDNR